MGVESFSQDDRTQPPQPVETEEGTRFTIGAKRNPDGRWDYSKAMKMEDPEGSMAKAVEEGEQQRKKERAKKLEIPADVQPGTSYMVEHTLQNAIFVNEEALQQSEMGDEPTDSRRAGLVEKLKMEQSMLDDPTLFVKLKRKILQEAEMRGEKLTGDEVGEKMRNFSANEMSDVIQEVFIDLFEELQDEGKETAFWGRREYPIKDLLQAARELQGRLVTEALNNSNLEEGNPEDRTEQPEQWERDIENYKKAQAEGQAEQLNPDRLLFNHVLSRLGSDLGTIKGHATMAQAFKSLYGDNAKPTSEQWKNAAEKISQLMNEYRRDKRLRSEKAEEWLEKIESLAQAL